jgi:hypothetical protein
MFTEQVIQGARWEFSELRERLMRGSAVAPLALEAFLRLLARHFGKTVVLGADPDLPDGAILGTVLVQVFAGALGFLGQLSVDGWLHEFILNINRCFSE